MASKSTRTAPRDVAARRARAEEMRRAQQAKERRGRLLLLSGGAVLITALIVVVVLAVLSRNKSRTEQVLPGAVPAAAAVTTQKPLKPIKDDSGIDGVKAWNTKATPQPTGQPNPAPRSDDGIEHDHVDGKVTYASVPPVGGPHNGAWMTCGRYTAPVPNERAVHDLEHGVVWITYRKDLPPDQAKALTGLFARQKNAVLKDGKGKGVDTKSKYVDLSPWADDSLPSPIMVTAWGRQLAVDSPSDPRIQRFIDTFRLRQDLTYEAGAQCTPPSDDPKLGGRPAAT